MAALLCLVCTEPVGLAEVRAAAMCDLCKANATAFPTHTACVGEYFTKLISESYPSTCPRMACLYHRERTVPLESWKVLVRAETTDQFTWRAHEMLILRCGACHQSLPVLLRSDHKNISFKTWLSFVPLAPGATKKQIQFCLEAYGAGVVSHTEAYRALRRRIPAMQIARRFRAHDSSLSAADVYAAQIAVIACALTILDPERRASLVLYHLRMIPQLWTLCCRWEVCFACQEGGYHPGTSCADNQGVQAVGMKIARCMRCNAHITKGDGCDAVQCVCGYLLSWDKATDVAGS